jgi:MEDS: MEthanogen/methylotroph, DcmR Sensory domain
MHESMPIQLGGARLDRLRHVCGLFNGVDEEYGMLAPFIHEGLAAGQKAFLSVDPGRSDGHRRSLREAGIDVEGRCRSGQLEIETWDRTHLRPGYFDQDAMLELVENVLMRSRGEGYPLTRLVANMEWALQDLPGVHDIVEYESRFNRMIAPYDDVVICTYDATRFGGDLIVDVLRTHPMVILGGGLQENPFYVPPDQLLAELRRLPRGSRPALSAHAAGK